MTAFTPKGRPQFVQTVISDRTVLGATVELDLTDDDFGSLTHCFLSVRMYDDADPAAATQIVDSAGTFTLSIQTVNAGVYESPAVAVIDATAPTTLSWAGNTLKIKIVPDSLSDTVVYEVIATANRN
jgi:hypothetical protein